MMIIDHLHYFLVYLYIKPVNKMTATMTPINRGEYSPLGMVVSSLAALSAKQSGAINSLPIPSVLALDISVFAFTVTAFAFSVAANSASISCSKTSACLIAGRKRAEDAIISLAVAAGADDGIGICAGAGRTVGSWFVCTGVNVGDDIRFPR